MPRTAVWTSRQPPRHRRRATGVDQPTYETADGDRPVGEVADVRTVAAGPEATRRVAQLLRPG